MTNARYEQRLAKTFPGVVKRFLGDLGGGPWFGTSPELHEWLTAYAGPSEVVPTPNAVVREVRAVAWAVTAAGYVFGSRRTRTARLVGFMPIEGEVSA